MTTTPSHPDIRPLLPEEHRTAAMLIEDSFPDGYPTTMSAAAMSREQLFLLDLLHLESDGCIAYGAFLDGSMVGTVISLPSGDDEREISVLAVAADRRRSGIGSNLLGAVRDSSPESRLVLRTSNLNYGARSCYADFGFREIAYETDPRRPGVGDIHYLYAKPTPVDTAWRNLTWVVIGALTLMLVVLGTLWVLGIVSPVVIRN
jgi:ribosomal protein S18 acetylase RimI-like enzyme